MCNNFFTLQGIQTCQESRAGDRRRCTSRYNSIAKIRSCIMTIAHGLATCPRLARREKDLEIFHRQLVGSETFVTEMD